MTELEWQVIKKLGLEPRVKSKQRIFRYLICGIITAIFNVWLIYLIIETWKMNTQILRNLAKIMAIVGKQSLEEKAVKTPKFAHSKSS